MSAFGELKAERLFRTLEQDLVAAANAITNARYAALVAALARAIPEGEEDVQGWLDDLEGDTLRARVEAVELALGPILGGREGDGTLDYEAHAALAEDMGAGNGPRGIVARLPKVIVSVRMFDARRLFLKVLAVEGAVALAVVLVVVALWSR